MSENSNNTTPAVAAGDFALALRGEIKLSIGALLHRAWEITLRSLPWMLGVFIGLFLLNMLVSNVLGLVFPFDDEIFANQETIDWSQVPVGNIITSSLLQELILAPFSALLIYVGLINAADRKPSVNGLRAALQHAPQIMLVALLKIVITATVAAALMFLVGMLSSSFAVLVSILAVIYIQVSLMLAVPLIIDRELNAWRALIASAIVINKVMFPVLGLMALLAIILLISAIPLLLGLIFTLPMAFNAVGVIYHSLIGVDDATL